MTVLHIAHPSLDERAEHGRQAREHTPLDSHTGWRPAADRPDPVTLLDEQNRTRDQDLVPVRHGRMMASPFTFYRGAAAVMAADLKDTPTAGLDAQLCGDAHLSNFGAFASPERKLLFDLNDFDETLPGPFEYDVKRMAASFTIAARNNGFSKADTREATMASVTAYREAMAGFAQMGTLEVWYAHLDEDDIMASIRAAVAAAEQHDKAKGKKRAKEGRKEREGQVRQARPCAGARRRRPRRRRCRRRIPATACRHCRSSPSWSTATYRIVSHPPIVVPLRELAATYGFSGTRPTRSSGTSSAPTAPRCRTTGDTCWSASSSSTRRARSSASAASAPGPSSSCCRDATHRTPCSCRSRKPPHRCWRSTCRRAATRSPANGWCKDNG